MWFAHAQNTSLSLLLWQRLYTWADILLFSEAREKLDAYVNSSTVSIMQGGEIDCQRVGEGFVQWYYNQFDHTNRMELVNLYAEGATLTWEGTLFHGREAIAGKLTGMPFQQIKHIVTEQDIQPTIDNSILIMVFGQLKTDNDPPLAFHQVFMLKPQNCNWVCTNDVFRLGIHNIAVEPQ